MPFLRLLVETVFVYNDKETPIPSVLTHHKILFSKLIIWSVSGFKDLNWLDHLKTIYGITIGSPVGHW